MNKNKIIKVISILIVIILVACFFIINIKNDKKYLDEVNSEENTYLEDINPDIEKVQEIYVSISWVYSYGYLNELIENSDLIFQGHIKSWDSFKAGSLVMTNYEFYIDEILSGNAPEGTFILQDCGGVVPYEEFYPDSENTDHKEWISFSSTLPYDIMPLDKDFIIFCKKIIIDGETIYTPVGNFQGVFMSEQGGEVFERMLTKDFIDNVGKITKEDVINAIN